MKRLPAKTHHVSLYLAHVCQRSIRKKYTERPTVEAQQAIKYVHEICEMADPSNSALAKSAVAFARRILSRPAVKSRKLTADVVRALAKKFANTSDVGWHMVYVTVLIGFLGFLRWDDITYIHIEFMVFHETHVALFILKSKTDQRAFGHWVVIARTGGDTCACTQLEKLIAKTGITSGIIPRRVQRTKNGASLMSTPLKYKRFLELMREALQKCGFTAKEAHEFGTRCMRVGGASAAAEFGVPDRLFQKHGRWVTERIKDRYVQEDIEQLLSVSRIISKEL
jgi:hypothetical protein